MPRLVQSQIIFITLGIALIFFFTFFNFKVLNSKKIIFSIVIINIALLVLVLLIGTYSFEARRWLNLGGFSIQPSELSKFVLVLTTAFLLSRQNKAKKKSAVSSSYRASFKIFIKNNSSLIISFVITIIFTTLTLLQKSLGNTLILWAIYIATILPFFKFSIKTLLQISIGALYFIISFKVFEDYSNTEIKILLGLTISIIIFLILKRIFYKENLILLLIFTSLLLAKPVLEFSYNNILTTYQRDRIETFLSPEETDRQRESYNVIQATSAISRGGLTGKGFIGNDISRAGLLPLPDTDFAISSVIEQFGLIGLTVILMLYFYILNYLISNSENIDDLFGKYIYLGVSMMIAFNTIQHIGMNIKILPVTGVPLPFISYGGSSLLTLFLAIGLIHSVKNSEEAVNVRDLKMKYIRRRDMRNGKREVSQKIL